MNESIFSSLIRLMIEIVAVYLEFRHQKRKTGRPKCEAMIGPSNIGACEAGPRLAEYQPMENKLKEELSIFLTI